jgi:type IV secretory pathway VirB9-like protein
MARHVVVLALLTVFTAAPSSAQATREVHYSSRSIVQVNARLRFTTMIVLPEKEEILDFVCGDKDFWIVSGGQNLAYVKPAKAGATTNLNLVTSTGSIYSFLLTEGTGDADLKLYIAPDDTVATPTNDTKKFYTAEDIARVRQGAEDAQKEAQAARTAATKLADERIAAFKTAYPAQLQFPYRFKANEKPFHVSAIYTDGVFTYIRANTSELPALYELKDGAPNLTNFQVEHGLYIVPKVMERGYLAIGKQRLVFDTAR